MSVANYLTFTRILISPIFLVLYLYYEFFGIPLHLLPFVLIGLMVVAEMSDAFDGFLARRYNQVTDLGKILDPMADSICRISVFLTFTAGPVELPLYLVFIILYRDSVVSTLRTICALRGFALAARRSGKIKAVIHAVSAFSILVLMIPYTWGKLPIESLQTFSFTIVSIACLYTLYSGFDYIYANRSHIARMLIIGKQDG